MMDYNMMENDHSGYKTIITGDGSKTFISPLFNETYHSIHGAIQESQHVFIENGLHHFHIKQPDRKEVRILEIGFGTGLNCLLTFRAAKNIPLKIHYTGVEHYPLGTEKAMKMDYGLLDNTEKDFFSAIHTSGTGVKLLYSIPAFHFIFDDSRFEDLNYTNAFDIIYFDAFAPSCQPHLWEAPFLSILRKSLRPSGLLITYGSKGSFKRALKSLDFQLESVPGPPGKREMTRAVNFS